MTWPAPESPRRFRGRLLPLLVACAGLAAFAAAPPQPSKAAVEKVRPDVARLRALVEGGERNAQEKDWDAASTRAEEAEVLVADWPEEALDSPEVKALLDRLLELEQHLPDSEVVPATPDPGLKEATEVVPLSGEAL